MNIVVAGLCGVGKSTIAEFFARNVGTIYLDFDELRAIEMEEMKDVSFSPCSASKLNLKECLPAKLEKISSSFISDIWGDTVFRRRANNEERLDQGRWLKEAYSVQIIILLAKKDILFARFTSGKPQNKSGFDELWLDWLPPGISF